MDRFIPAMITQRDHAMVPADVPRPVLIVSTVLSIVSACTLTVFLAQRVQAIRNWRTLPATNWLVYAIYVDSILFILLSAVLSHGWGVNSSPGACGVAILLCLCCYLTTKLIYFFLVEKVHVINNVSRPRMKSKLYLFNTFGLLVPFLGVIVLQFIFRIHRFQDGTCTIGMERVVILPLIIYDLAINVWLTALFLIPLRQLYSYKNNPNSRLRTITIRTFFGSCFALTSSIVNLSVIAALRGEAAWLCLMCCNSDILFNIIVVHWVTSKDPQSTITSAAQLHSADGTQSLHTTSGRKLPGTRLKPILGNLSKAVIVTNISARQRNEESEDGPRITVTEFDEVRQNRNEPILPGTIKVQTDHVREEWTQRESESKSDGDVESNGSVDQGSTKELAHQNYGD